MSLKDAAVAAVGPSGAAASGPPAPVPTGTSSALGGVISFVISVRGEGVIDATVDASLQPRSACNLW